MELGDATTISEESRVRLSPDVLTAIPRCFEDPGFHVCGVPWGRGAASSASLALYYLDSSR